MLPELDHVIECGFNFIMLVTVKFSVGSILHCLSLSFCVLQYRYSMVQYGTVRYSTLWYGTVQYSTVQYGTVQYGMVQHSTELYGTVRYNTVKYCSVQCNTVLSIP